MSEDKKRDLMILTDSPQEVKERYLPALKEAGVADKTVVETITNLSSSVLKLIDDSQSTVMILNDTSTYTTDLFTNSAIIHILENQDINFLMVDSVTRWREIEAVFDETNSEERQKVWTQYENLFNTYQTSYLISALQERMMAKNVVYAFISDNDRYIDFLFDKLLKMIGDDEDDGNGGDGGPITSKKKLPLNIHLPKIFMGWIWRVWYAPIRIDRRTADYETKEADIDTEAYIRRTVILKLDDMTVTYVHIHPNRVLNLSEVINCFDNIYMDLNTNYNAIVFAGPGIEHRIFKYIPWVSKEKFGEYETSDWLNLVRNYIDIAKLLIDEEPWAHRVDFGDDDDIIEDYKDPLTGTVVTNTGNLIFPRISTIVKIVPPNWNRHCKERDETYDEVEPK